jgi:hypothetical protein
MKLRLASIPFAFCALFFLSCHRSDRDKDTETQSASDNYLAEACWNDVFKQLDDAAAVTPDVNRYACPPSAATCYTVTVTPAFPNTTFPKTVLVDFGSTNCTGTDGIARRGQISAVLTGKYRDSLTVISITTNNYFVNDYKVQGTKKIDNLGHINGIMTYTDTVTNAVITQPDSKTITWNSQRTNKWIAGESTLLNVSDDVYEISGAADGRGTKGNHFVLTITTPLRVEIGCRYIVSGVVKLTPDNLADRIIDFGAGTCDDKATVTILGKSYEITLR